MSFKSSLRMLPQYRGNHEAALGFRRTYIDKVLSYSPIAYWPLNELAGATANCLVNAAQDGTYTGVTLGQPGIGDGQTCPLFDGTNDFVNIYSAALNTAFDGKEVSIAGWFKVFDVGVWTDGTNNDLLHLYVDANNYIRAFKRDAPNNQLTFGYRAGAVSKWTTETGLSGTGWYHFALTASLSTGATGENKIYIDASQVGSTLTNLGTWAGNLSATNTIIGAFNTGASNPWYGWNAHLAVWDSILSQTQITDLAVA